MERITGKVIYLAFFQAKKAHPIPAFSFWEYYIKNGIEESGNTWVESDVDWAEGMVYSRQPAQLVAWKSRTWQTVIDDITKMHRKPDVFLSYFYPQQIDVQAIKCIQKLGVPCVNFFCDHLREFSKVPEAFRIFDLNWPEHLGVAYYKSQKLPVIELPMPIWIAPENRQPAIEKNHQITFIGSKDLIRWQFFEEIHQNLPELRIYGTGWKSGVNELQNPSSNAIKRSLRQLVQNQFDFISIHGFGAYLRKITDNKQKIRISESLQNHVEGTVNFDTYISLTRYSQIVLGVNRFPSYKFPAYAPPRFSRLRDLEAPMLGACYLTEYSPELEKLYDLKKEIRTYNTTDELIASVHELQNDKNLRNMLRSEGQKRALNEHLVSNSIFHLLNHLKH